MASSNKEKIRQYVSERKLAYERVFGDDDPSNPDMSKKMVRDDLARFCREFSSTFHPDARVAANLDGRREVVLRIRDHLVLSLDELISKYGGE